ncbi:MAG TPA: hypothetical protein VL137_02140, partial [Polyangiaceae bacterium]|nr:hypothetical protein [Polyangiaceae bacterium]
MDNKPKIDLKARLGKKTVTTGTGGGRLGGPSIPPPVGLRSPTGIGSSPSSQPPAVDPSNPYSSITAAQAPVQAAPQAIKIEMSEEVVEAQKKGRSKVMILAGVTAVIGAVIGFAVGGMNERNARAQRALVDAQDLIKSVTETGTQAQAMADVFKDVGKGLSDGKYPDEGIGKLGGLDIPFDGTTLSGKAITLFKPALTNMLVQYAGLADQADEQKDKLLRLLTGSKTGIQELLADKTTPKVRWSVFIQNGPFGPWASMQPVPTPFFVKSDAKDYSWPGEIQVKDGDQTVTMKRYSKGEPASASSPEFIPVVPQTQASVCPSDLPTRLRREVSTMDTLLNGDDTPGQEKAGLIPLGTKILEELK